jgi:hypothetical protein
MLSHPKYTYSHKHVFTLNTPTKVTHHREMYSRPLLSEVSKQSNDLSLVKYHHMTLYLYQLDELEGILCHGMLTPPPPPPLGDAKAGTNHLNK